MNVCLFDVSEEDYYSLVFKHIAELLNKGQETSALVENEGSRFLESVEQPIEKDEDGQLTEDSIPKVLTIFIEKLPVLFENGNDQEIESSVQLMSHLLYRLPPQDCSHFSEKFSTNVALTVDSKAEIRLACLLHLYNASCNEKDQYMILLTTIKFALDSDLANILSGILKDKVDSIVSKMSLSPVEARKLFFGVAALLRRSKNELEAGPQSMLLTSKALSLIESGDMTSCKEVANEAAEAVSDFLRAKQLMTCDLLDLPPVKALTKHPTYLHLHQLFSAVIKGQMDQLDAVCRPELLKNLGISRELCFEKTRIAVLLNVAKMSSYKPIPYQDFAIALRVDHNEVEQWIVKAIGEGLLTARIDQIQQLVSVTSCKSRGFEMDDWKRLQDQLKEWKDMLVEMDTTIMDNTNPELLQSVMRV